MAAKVAARNLAHTEALKHIPQMIEALRPFVGKPRTLNQGGAISEKLRKVLPEDPNTPELNWWYSGGDYSLYVRFKVCVGIRDKLDPQHCTACYAEVNCKLCDVNEQTITALYTDHGLRTDYTEKQVLEWLAEHKTARAALSVAQDKLQEFGLYDQ